MLRCDDGAWAAYDGALIAGGLTLNCRQAVFRCLETDPTQPGWHVWQTNWNARATEEQIVVDWQGQLRAETRCSESLPHMANFD